MRKPKQVQRVIDETLGVYTESTTQTKFDVIHLYPIKKWGCIGNAGFHDSMFFNAVGFNVATKERRDLGRHDGFELKGVAPDFLRVFADGAFLIRFNEPKELIFFTANIYVDK